MGTVDRQRFTTTQGDVQQLVGIIQRKTGEARESMPVEYGGATVEIGFNAQYLLDFLSVVGTDQVSLELKDAESQGVLRPVGDDGGDYRYVVMPMRF